MRIVRPYIDENRQAIFVECENQRVHEFVNGLLLALLVFVPLALVTPSAI